MRTRFAMAGILALTFISLCANPGWTENRIPDNIVDLKTVIPSVTLDIRYYGDHNFLGTRVDGYQAPKCLVTADDGNQQVRRRSRVPSLQPPGR